MDEDGTCVSASSKPSKKALSDSETRQFFLQSYFYLYPETDDEETLTSEELLRIIKAYYELCQKLGKGVLDGSNMVQRARCQLQWNRVLSDNFAIEDLTFLAETFLLEYEMSVIDETKASKSEKGTQEGETPVNDEMETSEGIRNPSLSEKAENLKSSVNSSRVKEECVEALLALYYHIEIIEKKLVKQSKVYKAGAQETKSIAIKNSEGEKLENASKPETIVPQTDSSEKRDADRLEFIQTLKLMVRAALILFKQMNPVWMNLLQKVRLRYHSTEKKKVFQKSVSMESSASSGNPASISSTASSSSILETSSKPETSDQSSKL